MSGERWAIYRIHYGLDFLKQSIDSIKNSVDRIFVFYSLKPWVVADHVTYLGDRIPFPHLGEDIQQFIFDHYRHNHKVTVMQYETSTPANQFGRLLKTAMLMSDRPPSRVMFMEPDMVWRGPSAEQAFIELDYHVKRGVHSITFAQTEVWKLDPLYKVQRVDHAGQPVTRFGPTVWNAKQRVETGFGTRTFDSRPFMDEGNVFNFGFCLNPQTMLYKHLAALVFSEVIGDSLPSETWYRDKWLNWTPETTNIEIARNWTHLIPKAVPFVLPDELVEQLGIRHVKATNPSHDYVA